MHPEWSAEKIEQLKGHYESILSLLGEDVEREGLLKTPERVAKAMLTLTRGYEQDPHAIVLGAKFKEEYSQMVIVKDIDSNSKLNFYKSIFLSISLLPKNFRNPPILLRSPSKKNKFFLQVKKLPTRYGWTVFTKHLFNYSTVNVTVYIKSSLCAIRSPHSSGLSDSLLHSKL